MQAFWSAAIGPESGSRAIVCMKLPHLSDPQAQPARSRSMSRAVTRNKRWSLPAYDRLEYTTNYILLQIWDLFSLYICSNEHLKEASYDPVADRVCGRLRRSHDADASLPRKRSAFDPFPLISRRWTSMWSIADCRKPRSKTRPSSSVAYMRAALQIATFTFVDAKAA